MAYFPVKFTGIKRTCTINVTCINFLKRNYIQNTSSIIEKQYRKSEKKIHPYEQLHPWRSLADFSENLFNNIIYNKDGLVALNKPYGIKRLNSKQYPYGIPNAVNYTLEDALPYISDQLKYPKLNIVRAPEMYMSGVVLLAADSHIHHAIEVSLIKANFFSNVYWVITLGVPAQLKGEHRLAMKLIKNPNDEGSKAVIISSWTRNDEKFRRIKLLKTKFEVLSNSTLNLCSLVEISSSTKRWHAIRLFASTFLYTPILGDNICASQIQKVGDTYLKVDPFLDHVTLPPKLDIKLLHLLNIHPAKQHIIPAHIHLRSVTLPHCFGETITIEAPLTSYFDWTCKRLEFKYLMHNK